MPSNSGLYRRFHHDDEGKPVVTAAGDVVGDVDRVRGGTAYIRPKLGLLDGYGSLLRRPWESDDPFPLDTQRVESVTEDAVVLKSPAADNRLTPESR